MSNQQIGISEGQYNCIDCLATSRIYDAMLREDRERNAFKFDQAILGPAITMQLRGIRVDRAKIKQADEETADLARDLQKTIEEVSPLKIKWGRGIKPSPIQMQKILYGEMGVRVRTSREGAPTANKEAIAAILEDSRTPEAALPLLDAYQELSVLEEDQKILRKPLREDGRLHTTWVPAGTTTGRFSAKQDHFDFGFNLQAFSHRLHKICIPDDGYVLVSIDQMQAESKGVAYLAGCQRYKDMHAAGNVHVQVGQWLYPDTEWTSRVAKDTKLPWDKNKSYYDLFKKVQHSCLTGESEVLTKNGWVSCAEFDGKQPIVIWDSYTLKWELPSNWIATNYSGDIVKYAGRNQSFSSTLNHRLPVMNNNYNLKEIEAGEFKFTYGVCPISGNLLDDTTKSQNLSPLEARLLAAMWADGSNRQDGWAVFGLKKPRKLIRIKNLLDSLGIEWRIWAKNNGGEQIATKRFIRKTLDWDMIQWTQEAREAFLDELPFWDGNIDPKTGCLRIFNTDKRGMEIIATLCHLSNQAAKVIKHGKLRENRQQCWQLYIRRLQKSSAINISPHAAYQKQNVTRENFSGFVYCPTVSSGWFLMRHNGIISVTGNSNYGESPYGMARQLHMKVKEAERLQTNYFNNLPEIIEWQHDVAQQLKVYHSLTTPLGRSRLFLGRTWDDSLVKEAIAYVPQSMISQLNKIILWRIWNHFDPDRAQILMEGHDSNIFQVREGDAETVEEILQMSRIEVPIRGDIMPVGMEAEWGYNWGKESLQEWEGHF